VLRAAVNMQVNNVIKSDVAVVGVGNLVFTVVSPPMLGRTHARALA
jgi:hypothetical protein